ncbi:hypothetical protein Trydic_g23900 [Trypoxylus dichotomus]
MSDEKLNCKVSDIFDGLCRKLVADNEVGTTSRIFSELDTNAERVQFAAKLLSKYSLFPAIAEQRKDDILSAKYRQEGNEAFKRKDDLCAWHLYTKSISYATSNSECLSLAYANRSAVLYERKMYRECMKDIANAFKHNYPNRLREKLACRQEKARSLLPTQSPFVYYGKAPSSDERDAEIECASAKVEIRNSTEVGRHVVAKRTIEIGEVVAVERPYVHVLLGNCLQDHCYSCLRFGYAWTPCTGCVYAMYCSDECERDAWNRFHRYECPILACLYALDVSKLALLALRIAFAARFHYEAIAAGRYDDGDDRGTPYRSGRYEEIHRLATNTTLRSCSDLFSKAVTAAVIRHIAETASSFHTKSTDRVFDELLMRHLQTGPINFHEISEAEEDTTNESGFVSTLEIGAGAYAFLSLFNHSCDPNVVRHCHGNEIVVRAIRTIHAGEQLFDNYGYHYAVMKKADRRRQLERQYFFICKCAACEDNWPLYVDLPRPTNNDEERTFDVPDLAPLLRSDRKEVLALLTRLLDRNIEIDRDRTNCGRRPRKSLADFQETIKHCYALLGNRRPAF